MRLWVTRIWGAETMVMMSKLGQTTHYLERRHVSSCVSLGFVEFVAAAFVALLVGLAWRCCFPSFIGSISHLHVCHRVT